MLTQRVEMNLFLNGTFILFLTALLLPYTQGEGMSRLFSDPAHPGKCVITPNLILSPGEVRQHPDLQCAGIVCNDHSFAKTLK